jgi:hypothetical protein
MQFHSQNHAIFARAGQRHPPVSLKNSQNDRQILRAGDLLRGAERSRRRGIYWVNLTGRKTKI